jgi:hypothetical protein
LDIRGHPIEYTSTIPKVLKQHKNQFPIRQDFPNGIVEGQTYTDDLWDHSAVLPIWMKEYFQWHKEQQSFLQKNVAQWDQISYYLVECTDAYEHCGGTADRLGPLPFHIRIAARDKRLLLIQWNKPVPLETYLLPPIGGLDWRVPSFLNENFQQELATRSATFERQILKFSAYPKVRLLRVKLQSHNHASVTYDSFRTSINDPTFAQVYHDLWRVLFTPVPDVACLIEEQLRSLKLIPGEYIAVHLRALYAVDKRDEGLVQWWSRNSLHCATTKLPKFHTHNPSRVMPILFVSDSTFATQAAKSYAKERGIEIVHRAHQKQPLHLEKSFSQNPTDYYDTFVDLYMIGMSQCTAYNMGGFGRWGSLIGYNSSCVFAMTANMSQCNFSDEGRQSQSAPSLTDISPITSVFLPPMTT